MRGKLAGRRATAKNSLVPRLVPRIDLLSSIFLFNISMALLEIRIRCGILHQKRDFRRRLAFSTNRLHCLSKIMIEGTPLLKRISMLFFRKETGIRLEKAPANQATVKFVRPPCFFDNFIKNEYNLRLVFISFFVFCVSLASTRSQRGEDVQNY